MEQLRVLVVDDEPGMRSGVERALSAFRVTAGCEGDALPGEGDAEVGFLVEQAESGEEALIKIAQNPPDILLLDQMLPGIGGIEILEQMPKQAQHTLTIMITAYASIETAVRATKQGAYDFLPKPFTPAELKEVVRKAGTHVVLARRARKLAEEKKRVRFDFVRVLVHELKAPLGAVLNYVDMLSSRTLGSDLGAYAEVVERSKLRLQQMQKLISDLLDMTKIESGTKSRDLVDLDIRKIAQRCLEMAEPQAAARGITLSLSGSSRLIFKADQGEIEMILNNLVSNAVKYNRDGGQVDVSLSGNERELLLTVADTGIGMSEADQKKLFGEFTRIRNDKTRNILGSGLGLSILKKLVALYDGEVQVKSAVDQGSVFSVTLRQAQGRIAEAE